MLGRMPHSDAVAKRLSLHAQTQVLPSGCLAKFSHGANAATAGANAPQLAPMRHSFRKLAPQLAPMRHS